MYSFFSLVSSILRFRRHSRDIAGLHSSVFRLICFSARQSHPFRSCMQVCTRNTKTDVLEYYECK